MTNYENNGVNSIELSQLSSNIIGDNIAENVNLITGSNTLKI